MGDAGPRGRPPIARSPIAPTPPVAIVDGWEVSRCRSVAALTVSDRTPLAKVLVRADPAGPYARAAPVAFGRAVRVDGAVLVIGSGVGEWLLLGPLGSAPALLASVEDWAADEFVSAVDLTHGRALVRLTGGDAPACLSTLCAIDFDARETPNLTAFRSSVARVVTDVVRDDRGDAPSYLLHCERASGQYLFDAILDAGARFGVGIAGFTDEGPVGVDVRDGGTD